MVIVRILKVPQCLMCLRDNLITVACHSLVISSTNEPSAQLAGPAWLEVSPCGHDAEGVSPSSAPFLLSLLPHYHNVNSFPLLRSFHHAISSLELADHGRPEVSNTENQNKTSHPLTCGCLVYVSARRTVTKTAVSIRK